METPFKRDNLKEVAIIAHADSVAKGFWTPPQHLAHYYMLVVTELSEAIASDRIKKRSRTPLVDIYPLTGSKFIQAFLWGVKDSVEDELADAVIRLLDLYGYYIEVYGAENVADINEAMETRKEFLEGPTLAHLLWVVTLDLTKGYPIKGQEVTTTIASIFSIADSMGIDLMGHIELKMRYNKTRPPLHGKTY